MLVNLINSIVNLKSKGCCGSNVEANKQIEQQQEKQQLEKKNNDQMTFSLTNEQQEFLQKNPKIQNQLLGFINNVLIQQPSQLSVHGLNYFQLQQYTPIVLTGPSGVGKGTMINYLQEKYPGLFELSISSTTRNPRGSEQHGVEYYFVSVEEFKKEIETHSFAEYCEVHGRYYGTHLNQLYQISLRKKIPILDIDVQGGQKIYKQFPNWNYLFLNAPNLKEQKERLIARGTETPEQVDIRINNAVKEIEMLQSLEYYTEIINDKLDDTKEKMSIYVEQHYNLKEIQEQ